MGDSTFLHIKGGIVVNEDCAIRADVLVENGQIRDVGIDLQAPPSAKSIEAEGLLIIPGGIDAQTHLQFPVRGVEPADDFYTGTQAALAGGTTTIMDVVMPPKGESLLQNFQKWRNAAKESACCDYLLHVGVTWWNENVKRDMEALSKTHGVQSFKCFTDCGVEGKLTDCELYHAFIKFQELGALAQVYPATEEINSEVAKKLIQQGITGPEGHLLSHSEELEAAATQKAIAIANQVNCPLYVSHVTTRGQADIISSSRQNGAVVFGESTVGSFAVDHNTELSSGLVANPPLRTDESTGGHLMRLLENNDLQCTSSNHCTFHSKAKAKGVNDFRKVPQGVNGIEDRMSIIWEKGVHVGLLNQCQFVAVTSANIAKIFNIYPQKGRIAPGSDADVILFDPNRTRKITCATNHEAVDHNIFEGMSCHGVVIATICAGKVVYAQGKVQAIKGSGKFIETKPFSPYVYDRILRRQKLQKLPLKMPTTPSRKTPAQGTTKSPVSPKTEASSPTQQLRGQAGIQYQNANAGQFNQSSFKLSGEQVDDKVPARTSLKQKGQRETASHIILG